MYDAAAQTDALEIIVVAMQRRAIRAPMFSVMVMCVKVIGATPE